MPETEKVNPTPAGTSRAPDPEERLLAKMGLLEVPEAPEQPDTPVEDSGDAEVEEVASEETPVEESETPEPTLYDVKIDGTVQKVTLEEALAGYSRTQDATKKWQGAAEERRKAETLAREVAQDRERYVEGLKDIEALLTQNTEPEPDDKLADEDPTEYVRQRAQWDKRQRSLNALRAKRVAEEQKIYADRQVEYEAYIADEEAMLVQHIPEWRDVPKAHAEMADMRSKALKHYGHLKVTDQGLQNIRAAGPLAILRDAVAYRELMAAKPKVVKQNTPTPTAKPGAKTVSTKVSPVTAARAKLKETGDPKYMEEVFLQRLIDDEAKARR
jgi:hypothetical protein